MTADMNFARRGLKTLLVLLLASCLPVVRAADALLDVQAAVAAAA